MSNLNGRHTGRSGGGGGGAVGGFDMYRRVPKDLTESTSLGAIMSLTAMAVMAILFISETLAFFRTGVSTSVAVDADIDGTSTPLLKIHFDVSLFDVDCDYAVVDVLDALGNNRQNITKNVEKWQLDADGNRMVFAGKNRDQRVLVDEEHEETIEDLHEDGVHAVPLTSENFTAYLQRHKMAFVDFYAPWCVWCQRLHPTWEKFAEQVDDDETMKIGVAMVDCTSQQQLCRENKVQAFPTLKWFHNGEVELPDYRNDRTVAGFMSFAKNKVRLHDAFAEHDDPDARRRDYNSRIRQQHPGCQLSGYLMVNRVPGNFHIEARSKSHNLNAAMTNLTHRVNHLSFGDAGWFKHKGSQREREQQRLMEYVPLNALSPIDGRDYATREYHQAFHHYIKVVSTHLGTGDAADEFSSSTASAVAYQILEQSQLVYYDDFDVPEARFSYDISPMSVVVNPTTRRWYDYLTSLCAIIGGTFTTLGLIDASLYKVFKSKKLD